MQKNITFVIGSLLHAGGGERVLVLVANELVKRSYNVNIIIFSKNLNSFYELDQKIKVIYSNAYVEHTTLYNRVINIFKKIKTMRNIIKNLKTHVLISFMAYANLLSIIANFNQPTIITKHIKDQHEVKRSAWLFRQILYIFSSHLICVSKGISNDYKFIKHKSVICNPLPPNIDNLMNEHLNINDDFILNVGRLEHVKNQEILIKAYAKVDTNLKLYILGDGSLRDYLERLIKELNLETKVILKGAVKNPFAYYKKAKFSILSSRYEGFGNVIIESLSCKTPVISFDCEYGPNEIIVHEENGLLVKNQDQDKLTKAIQRLIDDKTLREYLSKNINVDKYHIKTVTDQYEQIIKSVTNA